MKFTEKAVLKEVHKLLQSFDYSEIVTDAEKKLQEEGVIIDQSTETIIKAERAIREVCVIHCDKVLKARDWINILIKDIENEK